MFVCECGEEFSKNELAYVEERHGFESPPYESFAVCPHCGSSDYEELEEEKDVNNQN
jgi:hypothetical protein